MNEYVRIMQYGLCHEEVTRKGLVQPCEKTAVAIRVDTEDGDLYPVCAYHSRGEMASLAEILEAVSA